MADQTNSSQYETIRTKVIRYLRFQYQNVFDVREHAEDFANEAFARALEKGYDIGYSVIWKIADNLAKQAYREQRTKPLVYEYKDDWYQGHNLFAMPEEPLDRQLRLLKSHMRRLDRLPRIAMEMRLENRSVKDISALMNVPSGTVKSWLSRSRRKMRQLVRDGNSRSEQRK
jgi:RNA polymerase sigma factor (sigma-70 family)